MAWTELHDTLPDHPKTKLLMAELGSTKAHAVGLLCALWCFTLRYGKEGRISMDYWRAFAADMGEKDPDGALAALRNARWVDSNGDGSVTCHDWDDYAGRLEDYRKANRERQRRHRMKMQPVTPDNGYVTRDVTPCARESHTTVPTQPNQTEPTTLPDKPGAKTRKVKTYSADFDEWWALYPRAIRDGKAKAAQVWKRMAAQDRQLALDAVAVFASIVNAAPADRQMFYKRPESWLNAASWETDPEVWRNNGRTFQPDGRPKEQVKGPSW